MRLPCPRFTVRWLMIAVAVAGVIMGLWLMKTRRDYCLGRQAFYAKWRLVYEAQLAACEAKPNACSGSEYHFTGHGIGLFKGLERKWARAARYPWQAVESEPP